MSKKEAIVESKHYQPNSTAFQLVASAKKSLDKKKNREPGTLGLLKTQNAAGMLLMCKKKQCHNRHCFYMQLTQKKNKRITKGRTHGTSVTNMQGEQ